MEIFFFPGDHTKGKKMPVASAITLMLCYHWLPHLRALRWAVLIILPFLHCFSCVVLYCGSPLLLLSRSGNIYLMSCSRFLCAEGLSWGTWLIGSKKNNKFSLTISVPHPSPSHLGGGKEDCRGARGSVLPWIPETPLPDAPCLEPNPSDKQTESFGMSPLGFLDDHCPWLWSLSA